jgi:hypothetical protein
MRHEQPAARARDVDAPVNHTSISRIAWVCGAQDEQTRDAGNGGVRGRAFMKVHHRAALVLALAARGRLS